MVDQHLKTQKWHFLFSELEIWFTTKNSDYIQRKENWEKNKLRNRENYEKWKVERKKKLRERED